MSVSDDDLRARLRSLLETADLETTTEKQLRVQLEEEFKCDLKPQKKIFKEEINRHLEAQAANDKAPEENQDSGSKVPASSGSKKRKKEDFSDVIPPELLTDFESRPRGCKKVKPPPKARAKKEKDPNAAPKGFAKPQKISAEFQEFTGRERISRGEAMKVLWAYIKEHDLQNPADRQVILVKNDAKLHSLLKVESCKGFAMSKHLTRHFLPADADDDDDE